MAKVEIQETLQTLAILYQSTPDSSLDGWSRLFTPGNSRNRRSAVAAIIKATNARKRIRAGDVNGLVDAVVGKYILGQKGGEDPRLKDFDGTDEEKAEYLAELDEEGDSFELVNGKKVDKAIPWVYSAAEKMHSALPKIKTHDVVLQNDKLFVVFGELYNKLLSQFKIGRESTSFQQFFPADAIFIAEGTYGNLLREFKKMLKSVKGENVSEQAPYVYKMLEENPKEGFFYQLREKERDKTFVAVSYKLNTGKLPQFKRIYFPEPDNVDQIKNLVDPLVMASAKLGKGNSITDIDRFVHFDRFDINQLYSEKTSRLITLYPILIRFKYKSIGLDFPDEVFQMTVMGEGGLNGKFARTVQKKNGTTNTAFGAWTGGLGVQTLYGLLKPNYNPIWSGVLKKLSTFRQEALQEAFMNNIPGALQTSQYRSVVTLCSQPGLLQPGENKKILLDIQTAAKQLKRGAGPKVTIEFFNAYTKRVIDYMGFVSTSTSVLDPAKTKQFLSQLRQNDVVASFRKSKAKSTLGELIPTYMSQQMTNDIHKTLNKLQTLAMFASVDVKKWKRALFLSATMLITKRGNVVFGPSSLANSDPNKVVLEHVRQQLKRKVGKERVKMILPDLPYYILE
jgi:hypothetical protein